MGTPNFAAANPLVNTALANVMDRMTNGKEMRRLNVEREALLMSLKATGMAQPATIINFNPIALALDGGIGFKVPSIVDESVPENTLFKYKWEGREYKATVLTIPEPKTFTQIKDVKEEDGVAGGVYDIKVCKQIEIAHNFFVAYTFGMLGTATGTGGVVCFEGDRRFIERDNRGKRLQVRVPEFLRLPNKTREYITKPQDFDEMVEAALKMQRKFCNSQTQQANQ